MALTHTPPVELGSPCPDFTLPATNGETVQLGDLKNGKPVVIAFICNHCPYVKAIHDRLVELGKELQSLQVHFVAISSNDAERYPEDSFENMKKFAQNFSFPYCYDESQAVAKEFGAVCTPDFFVYDTDLKLAYRGRLDDNWKDPSAVTQQELKRAVTDLLDGNLISFQQTSSMGCSIKWKELD